MTIKQTPKLTPRLTIGPLLFHWSPEKRRDFYYKIADAEPIDTVYLGEMICSKRTPFFAPYIDDIRKRLEDAGKTVAFSSLAEVTVKADQKDVNKTCNIDTENIEANDASALWQLAGEPHRIGQLLNVYNEHTMEFLAKKGATHFCLPTELPAISIKAMAQKAEELNVGIEVQVFGRVSLALSARCYHARAHDRVKVNCKFVCEEDADGMDLQTITGDTFLTINGIQTLSHHYLNLLAELDEMAEMGVSHFRISPHTNDMLETINIFNDVINNKIDSNEADILLKETGIVAPFSNGFFHQKSGIDFIRS